MPDLSDLLRPDAVLTGLAVASKKALFAQLATALAVQAGAGAGADAGGDHTGRHPGP